MAGGLSEIGKKVKQEMELTGCGGGGSSQLTRTSEKESQKIIWSKVDEFRSYMVKCNAAVRLP